MRLSEFYAKEIILKTKEIFGDKARVYLFGSRVDDAKKGGDIDLYIKPENNEDLYKKKIKFLVALEQMLGEQKIDVIIATDPSRYIEQVAMKNGIELNMIDLKIQQVLKECDRHLLRINDAYQDMQAFMLLNQEKYQQLTKDEIQAIDQYLYRFGKMQDAMGGKLFKLIIAKYEVNAERLAFIDILNKLEKLQIISSAEEWKILRKISNDLAHEYGEDPLEMASMLNSIYSKKPILENIYMKIKAFLEQVSEKHA